MSNCLKKAVLFGYRDLKRPISMSAYTAIMRWGTAILGGSGLLVSGLVHAEHRSVNPEEHLPRLRPVLKGALYRSGTPSDSALQTLCESGWKRVYSLYGEHTTQTGPRNASMLRHGRDVRTCQAETGEKRSLEWRSAPSSRMRNLPAIFADIIDSVRNPEHGPVLVHCWNGLHYAGMVSALALRQFCGLTVEQTEAYWRANANRGANYPLILANLQTFKPLADLTLTPEEQAAVCPDLSKSYMIANDARTGALATAKYASAERPHSTATSGRSVLEGKEHERDKDGGSEPSRRVNGYVPPQPSQLEAPRTSQQPSPQTPTSTPVSAPAVGATSANQRHPSTASHTHSLPAKG
jgi:protein tyrosine/serine phosphatase